MFNKINELTPQYLYTVQPVKLFESENSKQTQKNSFHFLNEENKTGNNPFHPDVSNSEKGNKLDILS